jgi:hypothetical protein
VLLIGKRVPSREHRWREHPRPPAPLYRGARWAPLAFVSVVVAWNGWSLRATTDAVAYLDDSSVHEQMVRYATQSFRSGGLPLKGWFPYLGLGSPQFLHYQSLGAMLTGTAGLLLGADTAYRWSLYLLMALWPLAVYSSARVFGMARSAAAAAAVVSPFVISVTGIGYERGAYVWAGYGVWAQLWGSWALPFAWAVTWRAGRHPRYMWAAGALIGITAALHFETGYLAFLGLVAVVVTGDAAWWARAKRATVTFAVAAAAAAWVVVPLIAESRWAAMNEVLSGTALAKGYGARKELSWLVTGGLFDAGRFPLISLAILAGAVVVLRRWRRDRLGRALVVLFLASLALSFGPTTWGQLAGAVPGHSDLFFRRFLMGAQLSGLYLAGTGIVGTAKLAGHYLDGLWRWLTLSEGPPAGARWLRVGALGLTAALGLWPAVAQAASYDHTNAVEVADQRAAEAVQDPMVAPLLAYVRDHGGGRTYAGLPDNWGASFDVGSVPVFKYLESYDVDEVGYTLRTASLMSPSEFYFDENNPSDYSLFGVRYLVLPAGKPSPVPARRVMTRGPYALWVIAGNHYVDLVEVTGVLAADRSDVGRRSRGLLRSTLLARHEDRADSWPGQPAPSPRAGPGALGGPPGTIGTTQADLAQGRLSATVTLHRPEDLLLSASYDPGWHVSVDGRPARTEILAPAVVGVSLARGTHHVLFEYDGPTWYPGLVAAGLVSLAAAYLFGRRPSGAGVPY